MMDGMGVEMTDFAPFMWNRYHKKKKRKKPEKKACLTGEICYSKETVNNPIMDIEL